MTAVASRAVVLPPRRPDWPERLATYIEARRHLPFEWGPNDCASFAAGGVRAMTGARLSSLLPAVWSSEHQALRVLRDRGGLEQAVALVLGSPLEGRAAEMVGRGAVVCVQIEGRATLGLANGGRHWCAPGEQGLVWRPMSEVRVAWEV